MTMAIEESSSMKKRNEDADVDMTPPLETKKTKKPGVVYLSRIPPTMTPHEVRQYLEPFGRLGRVYLAPDEKTVKSGKLASKNPRDRRKARFVEGWVEFLKKKDAKTAALALNGLQLGGKKSNRFYDDIWNIKYLEGFEWSNLNEQAHYERAVRQERLRTHLSQTRRMNQSYIRQAERAMEMEKIAETRAKRQARAMGTEYKARPRDEIVEEQAELLRKRFRQRKPIIKKIQESL